MALFKNAKVTAEIMGHNAHADGGLKVFYKHYYRPSRFEEGKAFFEIGMFGLRAIADAYTPPITFGEFLGIAQSGVKKTDKRRSLQKAA